MSELTTEATQTLLRQVLYLIRAYERDVQAAIADGRLPEGHCQGEIFTNAQDAIRTINADGDAFAALSRALNIVDAYRSFTMPRVDDGRENVMST